MKFVLKDGFVFLGMNPIIDGGQGPGQWDGEQPATNNAPPGNVTNGNGQGNVTGQTQQGTATPNGTGDDVEQPGIFEAFGPMILLWGVMIAAMYFILFRPQRKREKQAKEMQAALRVGDNILTSGGLYGKISGVGTDAFLIEFGENRGVRTWVRKSDVLGVATPTTTPPPIEQIEDKKEDKKEDNKDNKKEVQKDDKKEDKKEEKKND